MSLLLDDKVLVGHCLLNVAHAVVQLGRVNLAFGLVLMNGLSDFLEDGVGPSLVVDGFLQLVQSLDRCLILLREYAKGFPVLCHLLDCRCHQFLYSFA